ncbi:hypothetical protein [Fulvivirga sediminis]|uniref:Uncharacterized protein n=1 Tax=Fulvivirga sediminis TaxID=2803949 RepID=A0A937K025_9BACT|nr:hypothetical protein [Fulvivirga sediminis]MBL3655900.1 hypothetical protein [Fulvivirga sediminis]
MINSLKNFAKSSFAIFSILLLSTSCNDSDQSVTSDSVKDYSGEEIFSAIFFMEGELANSIDVLKPGADQLQAATQDKDVEVDYQYFKTEIMGTIHELEPQFFNKFAESMKSDNLYEVELGLNNARKMFKAAGLASEYGDYFKIMEEIDSKKVNLNDARLKSLNFNDADDVEKLAQIFKEDYDIDFANFDSTVGRGQCVFAFGALAVTAVVAGNVAVVVNAVYAGNVNWSVNWKIPISPADDFNDALVAQLSEKV